jgi:hypothetical protein
LVEIIPVTRAEAEIVTERVSDAAFVHDGPDRDLEVPARGLALFARGDGHELGGHALRQLRLLHGELHVLAAARVDLDDVLLHVADLHLTELDVPRVDREERVDLGLEAELDGAARVVREDVDAALLVAVLVLRVERGADLNRAAGRDDVAEAVRLVLAAVLLDEHLGDRAAARRLDLLDDEVLSAGGLEVEGVVQDGALHHLAEVVVLLADHVLDLRAVLDVDVGVRDRTHVLVVVAVALAVTVTVVLRVRRLDGLLRSLSGSSRGFVRERLARDGGRSGRRRRRRCGDLDVFGYRRRRRCHRRARCDLPAGLAARARQERQSDRSERSERFRDLHRLHCLFASTDEASTSRNEPRMLTADPRRAEPVAAGRGPQALRTEPAGKGPTLDRLPVR